MTTPLCNDGCAESVGWLPETSWPYTASSKASAQPIYCLSGSPHVPPRSIFNCDYGDARQDSAGTNRLLGSGGSITSLVGVIETSISVSNTTAYDLDVFGLITMSIPQLSIASDAVYRFLTSAVDLTSGTPVTIFTSDLYEYGVTLAGVNPWRHSINQNFAHLKTITPGSTSTFGIRTTWTKNSGTNGANDKMNSFASALRIISGNAA